MTISVIQLGLVDYATGLRMQQQLVELRKGGQIGDVLLLLEHTPVITLGRNAKAGNILASPEQLSRRGVEVFDTDRGGDVTFHGLGQLVGYPIFDLRGFPRHASDAALRRTARSAQEELTPWSPTDRKTLGAIDYVRRLEEVLIRTCADFRIPAERVKGLTGVWTQSLSTTQQAKIAAIGVHISRGVTSHGFALNVNTDLRYFDLIVPCGITSKSVTSIAKELGCEVGVASVAESLVKTFAHVFDREIVRVHTIDELLGNKVGIPMQAPRELRQLHREPENSIA